MSIIQAFTLRPLERNVLNTPNNALEGAFRVHLAQKELKNLGLGNGELVLLRTSAGFKGYAVAWIAAQTNPGSKIIAKVSDLLREQYELSLNDLVFIEKVTHPLEPLKSIELLPLETPEHIAKISSNQDLLYWIRYALVDLDIIVPNGSFIVQQKSPKGRLKGFKLRVAVQNTEPHANEARAFYFDPVMTDVILRDEHFSSSKAKGNLELPLLNSNGIGGLSDQITIINKSLQLLSQAASLLSDKHLLGPTTILLHGSEGTGKTLLLDRLAEGLWQQIYRINLELYPKVPSKCIIDTFEEARNHQPSLILMDDLDKFLAKSDIMADRLRIELAKLEGTQVVVAAAARSIHGIEASLRTVATFKTELEIIPPNARQREEILRNILGPSRNLSDVDFGSLAQRTHGFVGRDLHKLCGLARNRRVQRVYESQGDDAKVKLAQALNETGFILQEDFDAVIDRVQPTVLKESIVEVPKVRWKEIAGLEHVRTLLDAILIRPFKHPDLDQKFGGPQSRKGVLLFGPPGCAKTLIAQAVATESNQNFLAVKGSELIKMYVGESERAIRDVFRRARAAKPCIIFFDEIDSIGKSRERTQDSGLNVVTTLLNELDGIEALKNVFIIGATNRPDILDSALIRTGRFDAHIHIGLPDVRAREQILQIHLRKRPLAEDVDLPVIAARTEGSSGADISGLCSVAVELAISDYEQAPEGVAQVRMCHFEQALQQYTPHTVKEEAERYKKWRPGMSLSTA